MALPANRFRAMRRAANLPTIIDTTTAAISSGASFTIYPPAGAQPGDLLVTWIYKAGSGTDYTDPSGWTRIYSATYGISNNNRVGATYRIMQTGDTSWTITGLNASAPSYVQTVAIRHADTILAYENNSGSDSSNVVTPASVTLPRDGYVFWQGGWGGTSGVQSDTVTTTPTRTLINDYKPSINTSWRSLIYGDYLDTAGASGGTTISKTGIGGSRFRSTIAVGKS